MPKDADATLAMGVPRESYSVSDVPGGSSLLRRASVPVTVSTTV